MIFTIVTTKSKIWTINSVWTFWTSENCSRSNIIFKITMKFSQMDIEIPQICKNSRKKYENSCPANKTQFTVLPNLLWAAIILIEVTIFYRITKFDKTFIFLWKFSWVDFKFWVSFFNYWQLSLFYQTKGCPAHDNFHRFFSKYFWYDSRRRKILESELKRNEKLDYHPLHPSFFCKIILPCP